MLKTNKTINYYNFNAKDFITETISAELNMIRKKFTNRLLDNAFILDFGCGSGRDTKYFLMQGYQVDAIDGSLELCKFASTYTGINVKNMLFQDLTAIEKYDGIWACSSILHLSFYELIDVMKKMTTALKKHGIIYTSFKYGIFEGERNGRFFIDMTENNFANFLKQLKNLVIEEQWITSDVRPKRGEEQWLNLILRKK